MTAVFNAPDNGDRSVANEAKTSDAPKFDLQALYSDMSATTRGGLSSQRDIGNQIDFGTNDNIYARSSDSQSSSNGGFNTEQQSAMDVARRFASFDDNDNNDHTNNINIDREDVGRLVEVYGDMYNMQDSLQDGNKAEAQNWLGEMRRDLASFTRGLFTDSDSETREREGHHGNEERRHCPDESGSKEDEGGHEENPQHHEETTDDGSEHSEETSEDGAEHYQECESGEGHVDSGTEGYTPEDSMVLLQNDMQELTEALASGDTEAVQKIMARMNRHMALLMRQLNGQEGEEETGEPGGGGQRPIEDWFGTGPNLPGIPNPGDLFGNVPNPGDLIGRLPNPGDLIGGLPNPGDLLGGLPNPGDLLGGLPNPGDIFGSLPTPPNPQDIWRGVSPIPNPGDLLRGLPQPPNPGDLLRGLPQPPNPRDLLGSLPTPPNPGDLLRNLPSPGDLFDIF